MESLNLKTKIIIGIAIVIAIVVIGLYFYKESKNDYTYDLRKDNVDKFQVVFSESICPIGGEASKP